MFCFFSSTVSPPSTVSPAALTVTAEKFLASRFSDWTEVLTTNPARVVFRAEEKQYTAQSTAAAMAMRVWLSRQMGNRKWDNFRKIAFAKCFTSFRENCRSSKGTNPLCPLTALPPWEGDGLLLKFRFLMYRRFLYFRCL